MRQTTRVVSFVTSVVRKSDARSAAALVSAPLSRRAARTAACVARQPRPWSNRVAAQLRVARLGTVPRVLRGRIRSARDTRRVRPSRDIVVPTASTLRLSPNSSEWPSIETPGLVNGACSVGISDATALSCCIPLAHGPPPVPGAQLPSPSGRRPCPDRSQPERRRRRRAARSIGLTGKRARATIL